MSSKFPRPDGHHIVTPSAVVPGAAKVIDFLETAFDGRVVDRYDGPGGVVSIRNERGVEVVRAGTTSDDRGLVAVSDATGGRVRRLTP